MLILLLIMKTTLEKESQLSKFIVHDLGTYNTDRAKAYIISFYRSKKLAAEYNRDLTQNELDIRRKDTCVYFGENCISN